MGQPLCEPETLWRCWEGGEAQQQLQAQSAQSGALLQACCAAAAVEAQAEAVQGS